MSIAVMVILTAIILYQGYLISEERNRHNEALREAQAEYMIERQKLMDRIQAGSFAEYKQAEIRIEKIKNGEKEPPKLEPV